MMTTTGAGLSNILARPRGYYARVAVGLSVAATLAGGLLIVGSGEYDPVTVAAAGAGAGMLELVLIGTISHWASEMWRVAHLQFLTSQAGEGGRTIPDLGAAEQKPVIRYVDARAYAADTAAYQPGLVVIPNERGNAGGMLHVTPDQLTILKRRIRSNNLSLPINGLDKFSSVQAKDLRAEVLRLGLGEAHGNNNQMVRWTGEGAVRVLRASPTGAIPGL